MTIIVASAPSWTDIVTAIGTVLAGLALPLAFIQLGALRQDRLRAQVSKAGAWTGMPEQTGEEPGLRTIPVLIRNGSDLSLFGWVLCALPHQRPVAVAGEVWQALRAADTGAGALGEDPLAAVGFPTPSPQATQVVDADATGMELTGGHWRKGKLVRAPGEAAWRWEPAVRFSMDMTRAAGYWTADPAAQQLRLRAVATLPRADASELAISSQNRLDLEKALPESDLARAVTELSRRRGADLHVTAWNRGPNHNALDALSYSAAIAAPDGQIALSAEVMMALPNTMNSALVTCAEVRIEGLAAWARALGAAGAPPGRTCGCR